jgi:ABC-type lipoprotein release transport system permease subunit
MVLKRAVWHLAINSLAGRPLRTALLVLVVMLATALAVAGEAALGTVSASLRRIVGLMVGRSDLRLVHAYGARFDQAVWQQVQSWPEVQTAAPRLQAGVTLQKPGGKRATVMALGVVPELEQRVQPPKLQEGRFVEKEGEIVLGPRIARNGQVVLGDTVHLSRLGEPISLTVVGILDRPPLPVLQAPTVVVMLAQAQALDGGGEVLDEVSLQLRDPLALNAVREARQKDLPRGLLFQTAAAAGAAVNRGIASAQFIFAIMILLLYLCSGFIVVVGMTTAVTERQRELAILRCIGTPRWQLAAAQVLAGVLLSLGGSLLGLPLGLMVARWFYLKHENVLKAGFDPSLRGLAFAVLAAIAAGALAALFPAVMASRVRPLEALAVRAQGASRRGLALCFILGTLLALHPLLLARVDVEIQALFRYYIAAGLPLMLVGWFLLTPPLLLVLAHALSGVLSLLLRLPSTVLRQSVLAAPYRHGMTGGAMMISLAILVAVWTGGRSIMAGWFDRLRMPDAFAHSFYSLNQQQYDAMRSLDVVTAACPVTMFQVQPVGLQLGVAGLSPPQTSFVSCDPLTFFDMADLHWLQGDPQTAGERFKQGRVVIVSREFHIARGIGLGDHVTLQTLEGPVDFEIVGVCSSNGLDIAVQFFGIERPYGDAALSCVFGSRQDAIRYFNVDSINLVLLNLRDDVSDEAAVKAIKEQVPGVGAGTSRLIRVVARMAANSMMTVASGLAIALLVIACVGVGQLILAELQSRRFEYGVFRAVGAPRGMLGRLVLAQTLLVAIVGCVAGSALGLELSIMGQVFHQRLLGLTYDVLWPWDVALRGGLAVAAAAVLAALPAVLRLVWTSPRQLLATE